MNYGVPEITVEDLHSKVTKAFMIDVRTPEEFIGELGHIPGSTLIEMGPELESYLATGDRDLEIVFVCRTGNRSGRVTAFAQNMGYKNTINLQGGMIRWNELGFPIEKKS